MKCPSCGWEILVEKPHFCPNCNRTFTREPSNIGILLVWCLAAAVFVAIVINALDRRTRISYVNPPHAPIALPAPIPVPETLPNFTVDEVLRAYETNEVTADNRFRNRYIVLVGARIDSISKDLFDRPYLIISSGRHFHNIHATFDPRFAYQLESLRAGQVHTVGLRIKGMTLMSVMGDEAQIAGL